MNLAEHKVNILSQIQYVRKSRIYFQNYERVPMFGIFVEEKDKVELEEKGFVRFLSDSGSMKLITINELKYIELF